MPTSSELRDDPVAGAAAPENSPRRVPVAGLLLTLILVHRHGASALQPLCPRLLDRRILHAFPPRKAGALNSIAHPLDQVVGPRAAVSRFDQARAVARHPLRHRPR